MSDMSDEFSKFLRGNKDREEFLTDQLVRAVTLMKSALPFLKTWYESSHAGTGLGALAVMKDIITFIKDFE
jgi:hypothetical protein